jgi:hypothetical protein
MPQQEPGWGRDGRARKNLNFLKLWIAKNIDRNQEITILVMWPFARRQSSRR